MVFVAATQRAPDVLQLAFVSRPAANALLQLLLVLGHFSSQLAILLCDTFAFVLEQVELAHQLLMLDLNVVALLHLPIERICIGAVLVLELSLCLQ